MTTTTVTIDYERFGPFLAGTSCLNEGGHLDNTSFVMAHRNNDIFGAAVEAPRRAPSSYRPADSNIFAPSEQSQGQRSNIKTVFPGMADEAAKAAPRGDHGRSIHDASVDLGGGYGNSALNRVRPGTAAKHLINENDKAAGSRGSDVIIKQTESHNIFGAPNPLREAN